MAQPELRLDTVVTPDDGDELWPVYDAVFADQTDVDTWRSRTWAPHSQREGFRLARAYEGNTLVGFAYGYTGERGQWWTDRALQVLPDAVGGAWLGGHFELVSLGVLPAARSRGIGRALLRRLTADLPHDRRVLMATADAADPARRLYESEDWHPIGPGVGPDQVILAKGTPRGPV